MLTQDFPVNNLPPNTPSLSPFFTARKRVADFYWDAMTYGYGWMADIALNLHMLPGVPLTPTQIRMIRQFAISRYYMVSSTIDFNYPNYISKKNIVPLIDSTEKGFAANLLGGVLAQMCAKEVIHRRFGNGHRVHRIFHSKIFDILLGGAFQVGYQGRYKPDFIAEDSAGEWHVIEAKGSLNGWNINAAWKGILQSEAIIAVNGLNIVSNNCMASYSIGNEIKTSVFYQPQANQAANDDNIINRAVGLRAYAMWNFFRAWPGGDNLNIVIPEMGMEASLHPQLQGVIMGHDFNQVENPLDWLGIIGAEIRQIEGYKLNDHIEYNNQEYAEDDGVNIFSGADSLFRLREHNV